jgi:hypothetical protein
MLLLHATVSTEGATMIRSLFKTLAYTKAPKSTFALLHPGKALKYGAIFWLGKKLLGGGKRSRERRPHAA